MDFINWWFEVHYVWSTLLTPVFTFLWCIFTDNFWRGAASLLLMILLGIMKCGFTYKSQ